MVFIGLLFASVSLFNENIKYINNYNNNLKTNFLSEKIINEKDSDKEMIKLAENELIQLSKKKEEYENKLKIYFFWIILKFI